MISSRGEIWLADLNPVRGHEQAGRRPVLVISVDEFNHGPAKLVVVAQITSKNKGIPLHVPLEPYETGLDKKSYVKCEDVRSIAQERLEAKLGVANKENILLVEDRLRILLGL